MQEQKEYKRQLCPPGIFAWAYRNENNTGLIASTSVFRNGSHFRRMVLRKLAKEKDD